MANTNIDLVGLDFTSLRQNLVTFLKNNTQFKDLNYEGSNISVLLDVLAYNTYLNGFYTNMVASEMFLDTAQLRDSIVSHAKELNYTPRSFLASKAVIAVDITPASAVSSVVVPKYTSFTSRVGSNTYTFTTDNSQVLTTANNGVFSFTTDVYEGIVTTETFINNSSNTSQRFVISNPTVDASSIVIGVYEDGGQTQITYTKATQLYDISSTSAVFFVQGAENQQYEIIFGDGVFGRRPKDGSVIVVKYRACSGELPNGAYTFSPDSAIDGHPNISVTTNTSAIGGAVNESLSSIKFNAPRSFQSQNRAVTVSDYETLLTNQFADIQAISVYGGEDARPPQYGKVFISVDVANADGAPLSYKKRYSDYLKDKTPVTIVTEFIDPEFVYVKINTSVSYSINTTTKTTSDIATLVQAAISSYNTSNLAKFNASLYSSSLGSIIDAADQSINNNNTDILVCVRVIPTLSTDYSFVVDVQNALQTETGVKLIASEAHYGHTLMTSAFTYLSSRCVMVDDTLGNVFIAALQGDTIQVVIKVGTIDYTDGRIVITNLNITSYEGNYIEFKCRTVTGNIFTSRNAILTIDPLDVTVDVVGLL